MDESKKSVLLYTDWAEPLRTLPLEDVGRLFLAILDYTDTGLAPGFENPAAAMAFQFVRLRLDANTQKWDEIRQKRQKAGALGGKQRQANAAFARQTQANQAVTVPVPEPEPVPEPVPVPVPENGTGTIFSSSKPPSPEAGMTTTMTPEQVWIQLGLGSQVSPALQRLLDDCRAKGVEDAVLAEAIRRTAEYEASAPLPYLRASLERTIAQGCKTLAQFQAAHSGSGRGQRVDRPAPSGRDFLADAATRPFRRKRRD